MPFRPFSIATARTTIALAATVAVVAAAWAADAWHRNLDDGLAAAKKSGRPVFVVTAWPPGVCNACDSWRSQVAKDASVAKQVARFEAVEWIYDGLNGKVIRWTQERGGKSEDPAAQCFVVGKYGKLVTRLEDAKAFTPAAVTDWLKAQADQYERDHPRTAMAFVPATVTASYETARPTYECAEVDAARAAKRPVLVYVARWAAGEDKTSKAEAAASRKLEKGLLDSKSCAEAADAFTLVRLDVDEPDQAAYAATLGADKAPALLLWEPSAEKPVKLATTLTAPDLAFKLKKAAKPAEPPK